MSNKSDEHGPFDFWDAINHIYDEMLDFLNSMQYNDIGDEKFMENSADASIAKENTNADEPEWFVDIIEDSDKLEISISLPCSKKEEIELFAVSDKELEVSVKYNARIQKQIIKLPCSANINEASAKFNNGILYIVIPIIS